LVRWLLLGNIILRGSGAGKWSIRASIGRGEILCRFHSLTIQSTGASAPAKAMLIRISYDYESLAKRAEERELRHSTTAWCI